MAKLLGEILIEKKLISREQLNEVLEEQQQTRERTGEILIRKGIISKLLIYKSLAEQRKLKFISLEKTFINPEAVKKVQKEFAKKFQLMPVDFYKGRLTIATANPGGLWPESELRQQSGATEIKVVVAIDEDVERAIEKYYLSSQE